MVALGRCTLTRLERYTDGQELFDVGDRDLAFFVVKSGGSRFWTNRGGAPRTVVVLGPREFTGEVAQLTGGPSIVSGVARGETEVYDVLPDALRRLLNQPVRRVRGR